MPIGNKETMNLRKKKDKKQNKLSFIWDEV